MPTVLLYRDQNVGTPSTTNALLKLVDHAVNVPLQVEDKAGAALLTVLGSGHVGINDDNPNFELDVNGEVNADCYYDSGGWLIGTCSSDVRLKKNIKPLSGALTRLLRLNPVSFRFKQGNQREQVGLVAQEVEQVMPELVTTDEAVKKVRYGPELQMTMLKAIQEQHTVVDRQTRELAELRRENRALSMRLSKLEATLAVIAKGR